MTVTLNNGRTFDVRGCGQTGNSLHIDLPASVGFLNLVTAFDDRDATSRITYESSAETIVYEGFDSISRVGYSPWQADTLSVVLEKTE